MPVVKDGIVGIMSKPLVDLPDACKPLALTKAGEEIWTARAWARQGSGTHGKATLGSLGYKRQQYYGNIRGYHEIYILYIYIPFGKLT